ncbi:MAG: hypothetical protein LUE87_02870 [Lachnospiraceae bacterium]|nr:hypothetical protein [Lachnospiraceae bacterium]
MERNQFSRMYGDNVVNADMALALVKEHWSSLARTAERFGLYQRLDYLLHIPVEQMGPDNEQYRDICKNVRENIFRALKNPYLTKKNKVYLLLFAAAPKFTRKIHRITMRVRGVE